MCVVFISLYLCEFVKDLIEYLVKRSKEIYSKRYFFKYLYRLKIKHRCLYKGIAFPKDHFKCLVVFTIIKK